MSGPSSIELSTSISDSLGVELFEVENKSFPDGEHKVRIHNDVQNKKAKGSAPRLGKARTGARKPLKSKIIK